MRNVFVLEFQSLFVLCAGGSRLTANVSDDGTDGEPAWPEFYLSTECSK